MRYAKLEDGQHVIRETLPNGDIWIAFVDNLDEAPVFMVEHLLLNELLTENKQDE